MSKKALKRDEDGFVRFARYVLDAKLHGDMEAILIRHHVVLRDIYFDNYGPTAKAARVEVWWWLIHVIGKSKGEVARLFDRSAEAVLKAMQDLEGAARALELHIAPTSITDVVQRLRDKKRDMQRERGEQGARRLQEWHEQRRKVAGGSGGR